jgi:ketosteroid isomerase-like protein
MAEICKRSRAFLGTFLLENNITESQEDPMKSPELFNDNKVQTIHQNTALIAKYFECLQTGDFQTLGSLFADDVVWHQPGQGSLSKTYHGKEQLFALFGNFMKISEGSFKIDGVQSLMANDDLVTATLQFSAKKSSGSQIQMNGVDVMKVNDGKIQEVHLFSADQKAEDEFWG